MNRERIYLDWNATSPLWPEVRQAMIEALHEQPGNASSVHREGQRARAIVERARRALARAVDAPAQAIVFCGGATEANNQILRTHARYHPEPRIVASAVEHPSVLEVLDDLQEQGVATDRWPVDRQGRLQQGWLEEEIEAGRCPTLLSVMWANNEIGNLYPIEDIAETLHAAGGLLHVDATQALGRIPLSFRGSGADMMSLSLHKMGGPKGIGAVMLREGLVLESMMSGGHQERGRRPGTENVPTLAAVERFARLLEERQTEWGERLRQQRMLFLDTLRQELGEEREFSLRGDPEDRLDNTLNLAFAPLDGEDLLMALDLEGVAASSGSACTAGSVEPSATILAMGYTPKEARQSLRISFGPGTSDEQLREAAARLAQIVARLDRLGK